MPSQQFKDAVNTALGAALSVPDDSIRYVLDGWGNQSEAVPIYVDDKPTPEQGEAGGCVHCTFLGLWADRWPDYPDSPHGMIWLFEQGIRKMRPDMLPESKQLYLGPFLEQIRTEYGPLIGNTAEVMIHEAGHALQRNHVLDAVAKARASGVLPPSQAAGCGVCPGRG